MTKTGRNPIPLLFIILLVINAVLRFYEIDSFSLSNDELSGYFRSQYTNISDLIRYGVMATDPHPAGVQLFLYYWTAFSGSSPYIRIPFVLSSLGSLVFIYSLFKSWIGDQRALLAVSMYSLMTFTLIHGQLARPYAMGILTVSAFAWSWNLIVNERKLKPVYIIAFIISGTLSCYIHYYAALLVGIIGISGIFPAYKKGILKPYLLFGAVSALLFLPHISITIAQLSRGSLTNWIDPAGGDFFTSHLAQLLNNSGIILILTLLLFISTVYFFIRSKGNDLTPLIYSLIFFLCPVVVGYAYSHFFGSVLMDRVLYFSAPFFFVIPFMAIPKMKNSFLVLSFLLVVGLSIATTATSGVYFERQYVENFKGISDDIDLAMINETKLLEKQGKMTGKSAFDFNEIFLNAGNYNSPDYLNAYRRIDPVEFAIWDIDSDQKLANYMKIVRESHKDALLLSWACKYQPIAAVEYAKEYYPNIVLEKSYYNSGLWYLNKFSDKRDTIYYKMISGDTVIGDETEYFDLLKIMGNDNYPEVINVSATFVSDNPKGLILVYSLTSENGETIEWKGHHFSDFNLEEGENRLFMSFKMPVLKEKKNKISIYIWNSERRQFRLKNLDLTSFTDSHYPGLY